MIVVEESEDNNMVDDIYLYKTIQNVNNADAKTVNWIYEKVINQETWRISDIEKYYEEYKCMNMV